MDRCFLITVDCDLRVDEQTERARALEALLDLFARHGLEGRVTWFVNEFDFAITSNHPAFLAEAIRRGDTIGLHDHIDFLDGRWEYDEILAFCARSKKAVETWCAANGGPEQIEFHRYGCLFQREVAYQALAELGYRALSDVYPGYRMPNHTERVSFDNREVPSGAAPYRHDEANFTDWRSREGRFLQVPVFHMFLASLSFEDLGRWFKAAAGRGDSLSAPAWCFHPYELAGGNYAEGWTGKISEEKIALLDTYLRILKNDCRVEFINMQACAERVAL